MMGRAKVSEPDLRWTKTPNSSQRWTSYAITVLLLAVVVVAGVLASHSRDAWWQKYLSYIAR